MNCYEKSNVLSVLSQSLFQSRRRDVKPPSTKRCRRDTVLEVQALEAWILLSGVIAYVNSLSTEGLQSAWTTVENGGAGGQVIITVPGTFAMGGVELETPYPVTLTCASGGNTFEYDGQSGGLVLGMGQQGVTTINGPLTLSDVFVGGNGAPSALRVVGADVVANDLYVTNSQEPVELDNDGSLDWVGGGISGTYGDSDYAIFANGGGLDPLRCDRC